MPKRNWTNEEISQLLKNVAIAKILKNEDRFTIIAYQRAASSIENASENIKNIYDQGKLTDLPGVGKNIASHIQELFQTGKVKHFKEIFKNLPLAVFQLTKIPGIGPKGAFKLGKHLNIKSSSLDRVLKELKMAVKQGKIRNIPGFSQKSEKEISRGLAQFKRKDKGILLFYAEQAGKDILSYLRQCPELLQADVLGSLRRKCPVVGDIDISASSYKAEKIIKWFTKYPKITRIIESGEKKASIVVNRQYQVDLMVEPPKSYGSLLQHFTGSKQHNIHLREIAKKIGMSVSEHGIKKLIIENSESRIKNPKLIKFKDEQDFYKYLGMDWIPPELREDNGEIEAAQKNNLPKLIELADIKGDLHIHSSFDTKTGHDLGGDSMKTVVKKAKELGYQYIAFAEHNPSMSRHTNKQIMSVIKRKKSEIDKLNYSSIKSTRNKLFVFNALEIDIRPNGQRAVPDKAIELLDFGIASIHSAFRMDKKKMTNRILRGLDHPKVKILGHPTGRLIGKRAGYLLDWDQILDFCRKNNKFLEVNACVNRLDLDGFLVRQAIKNKVKIVINSDSHDIKQMNYISYGVDTARRGWADADDILNAMSYNRIKKLLISRPKDDHGLINN